jgi:hypothetical protein
MKETPIFYQFDDEKDDRYVNEGFTVPMPPQTPEQIEEIGEYLCEKLGTTRITLKQLPYLDIN